MIYLFCVTAFFAILFVIFIIRMMKINGQPLTNKNVKRMAHAAVNAIVFGVLFVFFGIITLIQLLPHEAN